MNFLNILPKNWILHRQVAMHVMQYQNLLLSYSGGLDSTVLLDILTTLRNINNHYSILSSFVVRAAHVHHGISRYADAWVEHCYQQCSIRNIPFHIIYIKDYHNSNKEQNIEASARYCRYQKLFDCLNVKEILVTGHHMNDQVETFFLALKRGSGPAGLSSMDINTLYYKKYQILRPLLHCSRLQLEKYASDFNISWIEDNTNSDTKFDRNFLRIKVLPLLYKRWPAFNKVVTRTAKLCKNQENLLNELLSESLMHLIDDIDGSLFFEPLLKFSILKRQAILRFWIINFSIKISSYQIIDRIWKEVILSRKDATPILKIGQYLCRRFRKKLYFVPKNMIVPVNPIKLDQMNTYNTIMLPYNLGLLIFQTLTVTNNLSDDILISIRNMNYISNIFLNFFRKPGKVLTNCFIRSPRSDEKISVRFGNVHGLLYIVARKRGRCLKKIWQELGIPPWLRSRIPLLFYNYTLIAAIGVFITKDGKFHANNKNCLWKISWMQDIVYYRFFKNSISNYLK